MSDADWIKEIADRVCVDSLHHKECMAIIGRIYSEHCLSIDPNELAERIAEACYDVDGTIISVGIVEEILAPILARNAAMEAVLRECRAKFTGDFMAAPDWLDLLSRIDQLTAKGAGQ